MSTSPDTSSDLFSPRTRGGSTSGCKKEQETEPSASANNSVGDIFLCPAINRALDDEENNPLNGSSKWHKMYMALRDDDEPGDTELVVPRVVFRDAGMNGLCLPDSGRAKTPDNDEFQFVQLDDAPRAASSTLPCPRTASKPPKLTMADAVVELLEAKEYDAVLVLMRKFGKQWIHDERLNELYHFELTGTGEVAVQFAEHIDYFLRWDKAGAGFKKKIKANVFCRYCGHKRTWFDIKWTSCVQCSTYYDKVSGRLFDQNKCIRCDAFDEVTGKKI